MAVIQQAFEIPDDIAVGLASGLYRRIGGVVRYAIGEQKGQIVKHLDPVNIPHDKELAFSLAEKALEFGKCHKKLLIAAGVVAGVAAAAGGIAIGVKTYKRKGFQKAFKGYVDAIRSGQLTIDIIEELETALSDVKSVNMQASEFSVLAGHIKDYTVELAENNDVNIDVEETNTPIIDLKKYLDMQKKILETA